MHDDPLLGQTLAGRYQVLDHAGEEMLGRVYKARDTRGGQLVNVKVLHAYLAENPEKVQRFAREITATQAVQHPGSVRVLDHGAHGDRHYLVLEYVRAQTLHDALQGGKMPVERAVWIAAQVALALDAAHEGGVVHRNLNPHAILLLENARIGDYAKVRDFGLSRLDDEVDVGGEALTAAGARIGNSAYMAPEYIENSEVSPAGDLYALGCLLYHMLTGRPPFEGKSGQVLMMHVSSEPEAPSARVSEIPAWLDRVVLHLLEKDPARRPHRGRMVAGVLEQGVGRSLAPPPLDGIDPDGEIVRAKPSPLSKNALVATAAVALLLGGGFLLLVLVLVVALAVVGTS